MNEDLPEDPDDEWGIQGVIKELYDAMKENGIERRWKKLAIARVLELETLREDLQKDGDISEVEIRRIVRRGEDLLNQLNRY